MPKDTQIENSVEVNLTRISFTTHSEEGNWKCIQTDTLEWGSSYKM